MLYKVIKGNIGPSPAHNLGETFDASKDEYKGWDIDFLLKRGVIEEVQPDPAASLQLAELSDKQLKVTAASLGVTDVARKTRGELVREILAAQAVAPAPVADEPDASDSLTAEGLEKLTAAKLKEMAASLGVTVEDRAKKAEIIAAILDAANSDADEE